MCFLRFFDCCFEVEALGVHALDVDASGMHVSSGDDLNDFSGGNDSKSSWKEYHLLIK